MAGPLEGTFALDRFFAIGASRADSPPERQSMPRPTTARAAEVVPKEEPPTLEGLFRKHADDVHRLVQRLLGPGAGRADVEDLAQQIFLAVHKALPKFRGESKASTWLYGIATRTVFRELRSRTRHRRMVAAVEATLEANRSFRAQQDRTIEHRQELARIWRCLLEISPKKRVVFVLHEIEGLSGPEIAVALQIKEATVHTRLYHARRELMAALGEEAR